MYERSVGSSKLTRWPARRAVTLRLPRVITRVELAFPVRRRRNTCRHRIHHRHRHQGIKMNPAFHPKYSTSWCSTQGYICTNDILRSIKPNVSGKLIVTNGMPWSGGSRSCRHTHVWITWLVWGERKKKGSRWSARSHRPQSFDSNSILSRLPRHAQEGSHSQSPRT
jgi:hypothetical protein